MGKPVHVSVKLGGRVSSTEQMIRKFFRECKKEGFLHDLKKKSRHESKGEKRRRRRHAAKKRSQKDE